MQVSPQHPNLERVASSLAQERIARWVGSRLVVGFAGTQASDDGVQRARALAEAGKIGGLIFFAYNVVSPQQMTALTSEIRSWSIPQHNQPLLLIVDQEGGRVQRLRPEKGFAGWPSALEVGAMDEAQAQHSLDQMAQEIAAVGLNVNAAPCIDLHDPKSPAIGALRRSFSESKEHVVFRAGQALKAHLAAGVVPSIKHFPGHGSATGDSHKGITDVSTAFRHEELDTFGEVLARHDVPIVMTSHLINKQLDETGIPATFSRRMITEILRQRLGFDGVAITDDLLMGALEGQYDRATIVSRAFEAGHDMLCISNNQAALGKGLPAGHIDDTHLTERCVAAVHAAVAVGTLTPNILAESERRLGELRRRMRALAERV